MSDRGNRGYIEDIFNRRGKKVGELWERHGETTAVCTDFSGSELSSCDEWDSLSESEDSDCCADSDDWSEDGTSCTKCTCWYQHQDKLNAGKIENFSQILCLSSTYCHASQGSAGSCVQGIEKDFCCIEHIHSRGYIESFCFGLAFNLSLC